MFGGRRSPHLPPWKDVVGRPLPGARIMFKNVTAFRIMIRDVHTLPQKPTSRSCCELIQPLRKLRTAHLGHWMGMRSVGLLLRIFPKCELGGTTPDHRGLDLLPASLR